MCPTILALCKMKYGSNRAEGLVGSQLEVGRSGGLSGLDLAARRSLGCRRGLLRIQRDKVQRRLRRGAGGSPIRPQAHRSYRHSHRGRLFPTGSFEESGPSGDAEFAIPISGPDGSATVYAEAEKFNGEWRYETLVAELDDSGRRINLLDEAQSSGPVGRDGRRPRGR